MKSYGQKKLNTQEVRNATLRFVLSFALLAGLTFLTVFMFFKSSRMQAKNVRQELDHYRTMLGKNEMLKEKMDTIYVKMSKLSSNKVSNDLFLRNSIIEDMTLSRQLLGTDSSEALKHYAILLNDLQPILTFKNDLIKKKLAEDAASRRLKECLGLLNQVKQSAAAPSPGLKGRLYKSSK